MAERYGNPLSYGANNLVVALSDTEVAKVFRDDTRSDIGRATVRSEAEKLKIANGINDLLVAFIRLDYNNEHNCDMLIMERLCSLDFRSLEISKRELLLEVFEDQIRQLHRSGFVHRDVRRPSDQSGERYDNVFLTDRGLGLIDAGISALHAQVGDKLFGKYVEIEEREMAEFRDYFLNR